MYNLDIMANNITPIGKYISQIGGYKAFVPDKFPPVQLSYDKPEIISLLAQANLLLGKLDGLTRLLPDIDFFIFMYITKEAAYSSQVEGTRAKLTDALEAEIKGLLYPGTIDHFLNFILNANRERKDFVFMS